MFLLAKVTDTAYRKLFFYNTYLSVKEPYKKPLMYLHATLNNILYARYVYLINMDFHWVSSPNLNSALYPQPHLPS